MKEPTQTFEFGQQYYIALRVRQPLEINNQFGKSWLYKFTNGKVAFLPTEAHQEIKGLNLDARQTFKLMRRRKATGAIEWDIAHDDTPQNGNGPEPAASPEVQPIPSHPVQTPTANHIATSITQESIRKPIRVATSIDEPNLTTEQSRQLFRQLLATVEAIKAVEEASIQMGRPVKFDPADIRSIAISQFIEHSRRAA